MPEKVFDCKSEKSQFFFLGISTNISTIIAMTIIMAMIIAHMPMPPLFSVLSGETVEVTLSESPVMSARPLSSVILSVSLPLSVSFLSVPLSLRAVHIVFAVCGAVSRAGCFGKGDELYRFTVGIRRKSGKSAEHAKQYGGADTGYAFENS